MPRPSLEFVAHAKNEGFVDFLPSRGGLRIQSKVVFHIEEQILVDGDPDSLVRIDAEGIAGIDIVEAFMAMEDFDAVRPYGMFPAQTPSA